MDIHRKTNAALNVFKFKNDTATETLFQNDGAVKFPLNQIQLIDYLHIM